MREFSFTLRLDATELPDALAAGLYAALPESTVSARNGEVFIELDRKGPTFADSVVGAIEVIERLPLGLRVAEIEPEELVFASEIAQRTGRTRESVSLLIEGRRGPGSFPAPARTAGGHKLWRWREAAAWFTAYDRGQGAEAIERYGAVVAAINGVLTAGRSMPQLAADELAAVRRLVHEELAPA